MLIFEGIQSPATFYIQRIVQEIFAQKLSLRSCQRVLATLAMRPSANGSRFNSYAEVCSVLKKGAVVELCPDYYFDGGSDLHYGEADVPLTGREASRRWSSSRLISLLTDVHKIRPTDSQLYSLTMALEHYPLEMVLAIKPPSEMKLDLEKAAINYRKMESEEARCPPSEYMLLGFTAYEDIAIPEIPHGVMHAKTLNGVFVDARNKKNSIIGQWHLARFPNGELRPSGLENVAERLVFTATFEAGKWVPIGYAQGLSLVAADLRSLQSIASHHGMRAEKMVDQLYDFVSTKIDNYERSKLTSKLSSRPHTITSLDRADILLPDPAVTRVELQAALLDSLCQPTPSIRLKTIPSRRLVDSETVVLESKFPGHGYTDVAMLPVCDQCSKKLDDLPGLSAELIQFYSQKNHIHASITYSPY